MESKSTTKRIEVTMREQLRNGAIAARLVNHIANMLDGAEWNSDTCNSIAELLRANGFTIGEPREETEC